MAAVYAGFRRPTCSLGISTRVRTGLRDRTLTLEQMRHLIQRLSSVKGCTAPRRQRRRVPSTKKPTGSHIVYGQAIALKPRPRPSAEQVNKAFKVLGFNQPVPLGEVRKMHRILSNAAEPSYQVTQRLDNAFEVLQAYFAQGAKTRRPKPHRATIHGPAPTQSRRKHRPVLKPNPITNIVPYTGGPVLPNPITNIVPYTGGLAPHMAQQKVLNAFKVFDFNRPVSLAEVHKMYRKLAYAAHPNRPGGSKNAMQRLTNALAVIKAYQA